MATNQDKVKDKLKNPVPTGGDNAKTTAITKFDDFINQPAILKRISAVVGEEEQKQVSLSIIQAHSLNPKLKACDPMSLIIAGLTSATYKLPINQNLGYAYIIPYKGKAQFQIGYKGIIQLALRSNMYKTMNVTTIKEGEFDEVDRMTGQYKFNFVQDPDEREKLPTIGYIAYFELVSGFQKAFYMSRAQMENHAKTYSESYKSDLRYNKKSSFWSKNFDEQGLKTVLKQLLTKWGVLSIEMQKAFMADQSVGYNIDDLDQYEYVDNGGNSDVEILKPEDVDFTGVSFDATQNIDEEDMPTFMRD